VQVAGAEARLLGCAPMPADVRIWRLRPRRDGTAPARHTRLSDRRRHGAGHEDHRRPHARRPGAASTARGNGRSAGATTGLDAGAGAAVASKLPRSDTSFDHAAFADIASGRALWRGAFCAYPAAMSYPYPVASIRVGSRRSCNRVVRALARLRALLGGRRAERVHPHRRMARVTGHSRRHRQRGHRRASGQDFDFPSQTAYVARDRGLNRR